MRIHLNQIPPGGLHLEGEEDAAALDLEEAGIKTLSPLYYNLDVGVSNGGIFATGSLRITVELECVRTLELFAQEISVLDFAMQESLEGADSVDLTPHMREDILLALPPHPKKEGTVAVRTHLESDNLSDGAGTQTPSSDATSIWKALDQLNKK